ncbi:MAG: hypothetical protein JSS34_02690 [Proteobacteria bacterium]|nr:hypothetical protein [Pseudomonadota bacterium]
MKKQIFQSFILFVACFLTFSMSYALDPEEHELSSLMGNVALYSPKRSKTGQRPACPSVEKHPQRPHSAPTFKKDTSEVPLSEVFLAQGLDAEPMQDRAAFDSPSPPLPLSFLASDAPAPMDILPLSGPSISMEPENTPPKKNKQATTYDATSSSFLYDKSPLRSQSRRNLSDAFTMEKSKSLCLKMEVKKRLSNDDSSEEESVLEHQPYSKTNTSKRGRRKF